MRTIFPSSIVSMSMPSRSIRAPVGSIPWKGPPQKVPEACQRTAAWLRAATTSSTSKRMSGIAANVSPKNATISSGTLSGRPSGAMFSMPPGAQNVAMACGSRAATASK